MKKLLPIVLTLAGACSDTVPDADPWSVSEMPNSSTNNVAANNVVANNIATNNSMPLACREVVISRFELPGPEFEGGPMVFDDRVFQTGSDENNPVPGVFEWDESGLQRVTSSSADTRLAGLSVDSVWFSQDNVLGRLDLATDEEQLLDTPIAVTLGTFGYFAQLRQNAFADRFSWTQENEVWLFDGSDTVQLWAGAQTSPWMDETGLTYIGYESGAQYLAMVPRQGEGWRIWADGFSLGFPVLAADRVFHLDGGDVFAAAVSDAVVQDIKLDGTCGPLYTDGQTIVMGCTPTELPSDAGVQDYLTMAATEVWTVNAATGETTRIHTTEDRSIFAPVVNERWIAWVEYDPLVNNPDALIGTIMVKPRATGTEPVAIAQMGQGCPYCGAYWPPPRFALGGDTLVWNYAIDDPSPGFGLRNSYGVARLCP